MIHTEAVSPSSHIHAHTHEASVPGDVNGAAIRAYVERVERLESEIKEKNEDKSEVFKEAKGNGYDVAAIKEIIKQRRQDPDKRTELETIVDLYLRSMGEG